MLVLMGILMLASTWNDSATSDDNVSLMSGYSYLKKQEYRLEPQNPPLIKELASFPLLFMGLRAPWDHKHWVEDNDPDGLGRVFLYSSGNDADAMLRAAKLPLIVLTVGFGWFLFWWTRKEFGDSVALLCLFLYAFSPTVLAYGRLLTTDVGSTAGFFIGTVTILRFLNNPSWRNVTLAGMAMGFALLTKFSTIALIPIAFLLAVLWVLLRNWPELSSVLTRRKPSADKSGADRRAAARRVWASIRCCLRCYLGRTACIIAIASLTIYPVYLHATWNYAPARQLSDAQMNRVWYDLHGTARDIVIWASDKPVLRPWAEYGLGLLVALKASNMGQPVFLLGKVYPIGVRSYFPFVYLIKEPLAMHLLTALALALALSAAFFGNRRPFFQVQWLKEHFTGVAFLIVMGIYWTALIRSNMNIGVRHLMPVLPLTYILVARQIVGLRKSLRGRPVAVWVFRLVLASMLGWQAFTVCSTFPSYVAYFNELAGGPEGGWRYVNDSNLDWGQDLKRLAVFVKQQNISGIHLDVFGPADPAYYLKSQYLGSSGCSRPPKGWIAVSAMVYTGPPWNPDCDFRRWLPIEKRVAQIGHSIFVFHNE